VVRLAAVYLIINSYIYSGWWRCNNPLMLNHFVLYMLHKMKQ
jgi:hypothetical protein